MGNPRGQRAVLSDSSSSDSGRSTEFLYLPSSSTLIMGTSESQHESVDMLSPGDSVSIRPGVCSSGCGGCGGGRWGLWRGGLGMGRDLGSVLASGGGDESVWLWLCPGEVRTEPP